MKLYIIFVSFLVISAVHADWRVKSKYSMSDNDILDVIKMVNEGIAKGGSRADVAKHIRNELNKDFGAENQAWGCLYDGNGDWGVAFKYTRMISLILEDVRDACNADTIYCVLSV